MGKFLNPADNRREKMMHNCRDNKPDGIPALASQAERKYIGSVVKPVSYTHLDVYKRQIQPTAGVTILTTKVLIPNDWSTALLLTG